MDTDNWQEMEEGEWDEEDSWFWENDMPVPTPKAWPADLTW